MEKIRQEQTNVDNLRIALGINEEEAAGDAPSPVIEQVTLQRLEGERIEASVSFAKEQEQLENLKAKSPEELKNALPTVVTDHQLDDLLTELSQAQTALAGLRKDYGPENPEVIKTSAIVDNLTGQVDARIDGTLVGLQSRVDADKAALDKLTESVESARTTDVEKVAKSRPYYDAKQKLQELEAFAKALNIKIASTTVELELPKTTMVEITDRADPTTLKPVKPNRPLNIALGIIFGLIVGVGLAFFIEYLDTSVKTIDDVERALQAPVLGVIPQNVGRLIDEGAESPHAEAYRVLRTNLLFSRKDEKLNTIAIVSAGAGEGKSTTIFNLATVFAQNGQRVVVVDSDLRRPSLHKFLRVSNSIGLTNYLLKQNTLEEVIQTTNVPTLDFMASGKLPSSSMGILSSAAMKGLISELKQRYDFVFFDSPPIMGVSDASILASEVDMTLQVIQYRRYPQPMNIRAKQLIEKVGGNLMGIVLNNINMSQDESYYYYSGYYHEYYSKHDEEDADDDASGAKARLDIKQKY
jgi:capsular exopolysaccharide synthesis family protein